MEENSLHDMEKEAEKWEKWSQFCMKTGITLVFACLATILITSKEFQDTSTGSLLMLSFGSTPFISFWFSRKFDNNAYILRGKIDRAKTGQSLAEQRQRARKNVGNLKAACMEVFTQNHRPKTSYPVTVCFYTLENLPTVRKFGKGDLCKKKDCWIDESENPTLCISNTIDDLKLFLQRNPEWFATVESSKQRIIFARIPLSDISHYSVIGSINNHQTITGGNVTGYTGVSVNGIGFGSVDRDPVVVHDRITDDRMVELVYLDGTEPKTMLFSYESLPALRKLLPQFDRP